MGYYMEVPKPTNKAEQLIKLYGAKSIEVPPKSLTEVPEGKALVVVVENGYFDAAAYAWCQSELDAFLPYDGHRRTWLLIDKDKVIKNILENHGVDLAGLK